MLVIDIFSGYFIKKVQYKVGKNLTFNNFSSCLLSLYAFSLPLFPKQIFMELTASTIAEYLKGEVEGNADITVQTVARIEQGKPGALCFLANPKYEKYLYTTKASIVLINKSFVLKEPVACTLVRVENAYEGIAALLDLYQSMRSREKKGRSWRASIAWSAKVGRKAYIGPFAYVGKKALIGNNVKLYPHVYIGDNVTIGDNTIIYAGAKIYQDCQVGANCIVHAGAVIGADGFGFAPTADGSYKKIQQTGNVVLEDFVEVGANTTIDRATMGSTVIRQGVKVDNLVMLAHNVEIDQNTVIAAQAGISGSTKVGKGCVIGGQVGFGGHITIADKVMVGAQSGIVTSITEAGNYRGSPAFEFSKYQRCYAVFKNLPELRSEVLELKKKLSELNKKE